MALEHIGRLAEPAHYGRQAEPSRGCLLSLLEATPGVVMVSTSRGRLLYMNEMGRRLLGVEAGADVESWGVAEFFTARSYAQFLCEGIPSCLATGAWRGESTLADGHGNEIPVSLVLAAHRDAAGGPPMISAIAWDISEHKQTEERLLHQAMHDDLTGLPNRTLLLDRLTKALHSAERHRRQVGLLFIDLDGFKQINDELGHEAGNELLCELARRLRLSVRAEDTVARYGGDEFVLLAPSLQGSEAPQRIMQKVRDALARPFDIGGRRLTVGASVGVALYPDDAEDADSLLKRADALMYSAKSSSRDSDDRNSNVTDLPTHGRNRIRWMGCGTRYPGVA